MKKLLVAAAVVALLAGCAGTPTEEPKAGWLALLEPTRVVTNARVEGVTVTVGSAAVPVPESVTVISGASALLAKKPRIPTIEARTYTGKMRKSRRIAYDLSNPSSRRKPLR